MMNLNSRLGEYFRLSSERDKLSSEVNDLTRPEVALDTQVAYATSDRAVEDWARNDAHLARPGDKLIIPVTPVDQTPVPVQQVTSTPSRLTTGKSGGPCSSENNRMGLRLQ